jgi:adenosylhomocysteine nucleosidase
VTFARPEESGPFRRRLTGLRRIDWGGLPAFGGSIREVPVLVIHVGIGLAAAERAIRAVLSKGTPRLVIAAGFAGGLDPRLQAGDTITEDFSGPSGTRRRAILSRGDPVETVTEKATVFRETGASVVDMETDAIAGVCGSSGVPLIAVRAVSDTADEALPVPFWTWFDVARQRPRPLALVGHLLRAPSGILPFARFVLRLPRVAASLAQAIEKALRAFDGR